MASIILISDNGAGFVTGQTNMNNINIKNNIFFAKTATQKTFWIYAKIAPVLPPKLNSDSSYFSRPIDNNGSSLLTNFNDQAGQVITRTLANWQPYSGEDAHSGTTPKAITNVSDLRFEYNATSSPCNNTVRCKLCRHQKCFLPGYDNSCTFHISSSYKKRCSH